MIWCSAIHLLLLFCYSLRRLVVTEKRLQSCPRRCWLKSYYVCVLRFHITYVTYLLPRMRNISRRCKCERVELMSRDIIHGRSSRLEWARHKAPHRAPQNEGCKVTTAKNVRFLLRSIYYGRRRPVSVELTGWVEPSSRWLENELNWDLHYY